MDDQKSPKRSKVIRWVLAGSLGLNLLFVGAFVGAAYRGGTGHGAPGTQSDTARGYAAPYVRALPHESRKALFKALRQEQKSGPLMPREARRALHQRMVSVLRATPFDPAAAEQVLTAQRDAELSVQSVAQTIWLKAVTDMDAQARAEYADALEKALEHGLRRRGSEDKRDR